MKIEGHGKLLRIFIGEGDHVDGRSLAKSILLKAREIGLAGATVIRGIQGFGAGSRVIHSAKILRLSEDLPILIECVDTEERIRMAIDEFEKLIDKSGAGVLMTLEYAEIIRYHQ